MAWLVKNSATLQVPRRPEPYLDDALKADLTARILPRYPTTRAATLPVLHALQGKHGWLPLQAIEEAAAFLSLTPTEVLDTASFYEEFHLQPKGRFLIMVCQSLSCELMGHRQLLDEIRAKLGIEPGQTTPDGQFTLMTVECLGACGGAPAALVDEHLHENVTPATLSQVLDAVRGKSNGHGRSG